MKIYFSLLAALLLALSACNGTDSATKAKTEQESYKMTREDLLKKEQKSPQHFLMADGRDKKNLIGQTVIRGSLTNKASIAVFKDITVKLSFYSKTKALLETDNEVIYETLHPGDTKSFKTKYFAPKGTDSVALEVISAKVVPE